MKNWVLFSTGNNIITLQYLKISQPIQLDLDSAAERYRANVYLLMYFQVHRSAIYVFGTHVCEILKKDHNRLPVKM